MANIRIENWGAWTASAVLTICVLLPLGSFGLGLTVGTMGTLPPLAILFAIPTVYVFWVGSLPFQVLFHHFRPQIQMVEKPRPVQPKPRPVFDEELELVPDEEVVLVPDEELVPVVPPEPAMLPPVQVRTYSKEEIARLNRRFDNLFKGLDLK